MLHGEALCLSSAIDLRCCAPQQCGHLLQQSHKRHRCALHAVQHKRHARKRHPHLLNIAKCDAACTLRRITHTSASKHGAMRTFPFLPLPVPASQTDPGSTYCCKPAWISAKFKIHKLMSACHGSSSDLAGGRDAVRTADRLNKVRSTRIDQPADGEVKTARRHVQA